MKIPQILMFGHKKIKSKKSAHIVKTAKRKPTNIKGGPPVIYVTLSEVVDKVSCNAFNFLSFNTFIHVLE